MMLRTRMPRVALAEAPPAQLPANAGGATVTPLFLPARPMSATPYSRRRLPSWRTLSFLLVVLLPTAAATIYYLAIAADQYVAEFRMSLRSADTPRIEPLVLFGGSAAQPTAAAESQIVTQFIGSRAIVDELDPRLDLRRLFSSPEADWWTRLSLPASIERLVYCWQYHVDPFYDTSTGTIVVRVRAFTPDDSLRLAQAIVASSERLINDLSARARQDTLQYSQADVAAAEARLEKALAAIRDFRNKEGLIDPGKAADQNSLLATKLRDDQLKANSELATLKTYLRDDSPAVQVLKARIRSLETQQRALGREMTASPPPQTAAPLAVAPARAQQLDSDEAVDAVRIVAEAAYLHALESLDRARDAANQQHIYIESFVPPSLPQSSLYPRRWLSIATAALVAFAVWAIGSLAAQSVREHL